MTDIEFGPGDRFSLPAEYTIRYEVGALHVALDMRFDGRDVRMVGTTVTGFDLSARDLASIRPNDHVRAGTDKHLTDTGDPGDKNHEVASIYWREHVSWGNPRVAVAEHFGIARTTANTWIREAAKQYPMPGPHAAD